jgi:hypothetical protein
MSDAREKLSMLAKGAARLNKESDEINKIISDFEAKLAGMNLGIEVWVQDPAEYAFDQTRSGYLGCVILNEPDPGAPKSNEHWRVWTLGYSKINEKWRIAMKCTELAKVGGEYTEWQHQSWPLSEIGRDFRIKALGMMGDLFDRLNEKMEEMLGDIGKGKEFLKSID